VGGTALKHLTDIAVAIRTKLWHVLVKNEPLQETVALVTSLAVLFGNGHVQVLLAGELFLGFLVTVVAGTPRTRL
jgi:hypothetical protein